MAFYKQPCIHCGTFIDGESKLCPTCGSRSPFCYLCPSCLIPIERGAPLCSNCGRPLQVICPTCRRQTFAGERCDACGAGLMVYCKNPRCGQLQFFENQKCTACGKKMK